MKVGIIIHSQSGNTASLASAIGAALREKGAETDIHLLRTDKPVKPNTKNIGFRKMPDLSEYDTVLFGAPVWAFNASPVIVSYLKELDNLKGKRALPFVTHASPWKFLGTTKALSRMSDLLDMLAAEVLEGEDMQRLFKENSKKKDSAVSSIVKKVME